MFFKVIMKEGNPILSISNKVLDIIIVKFCVMSTHFYNFYRKYMIYKQIDFDCVKSKNYGIYMLYFPKIFTMIFHKKRSYDL